MKISLAFLAILFVSAGCAPPSAPQSIPKENSGLKCANLIVGELIEGRYYCLPGCCGHKLKTSSCAPAQLEKELLRRDIQMNIACY